MAHKEILNDIRFFNPSGHEVQYLIDHNGSADDVNDNFYPIVCTHQGEAKALHLKNDGTDMICTIFDSKSPKALFNVSESFREDKNIDNRRKWQAPPMVVEAEVHENSYCEIESDSGISDNEASDEDLALNQEIEDSQITNLNSKPSVFFVHEPNKTLKMKTDTLNCDKILVNRENGSVLKTVSSWISKGKLPTKDVESRQCKGLLADTNQFEKMFDDKETQLNCRKSKLSSKQFCLPRSCFIEAFIAADGHRFSGHPSFISKTIFDISIGMECINGYKL